MTNPFTSVLDLMDSDASATDLKTIHDELLTMDMRLRRQMDAGLSPADMSKAQSARAAVQSAERILKKMQS
ncbi:hypothetical protein MASR1M90_07920 [Desulfovibrionales bacterium]